MAKSSKLPELIMTVTRDVVAHPHDLTKFYGEKLQISRVAANKYVKKLEEAGWLARSGPSTHPVFSPGYKRRVGRTYELEALEEHTAWAKDFKPYFSLSPNLQNIASYGFTEMVNNAIDHSGGKQVSIGVSQDEESLTILIADDGVGIFSKIATALNLPDKRQALFELSTGKLTTDPSKHSGEGVFFTSRVFDKFVILADGLMFSHSESAPDYLIESDEADKLNIYETGTSVFMRIALGSERRIADVFDEFTDAPEDTNFSKTVIPMRLAQYGDEQLVSRSQAKRLITRFDRFRVVVLDFTNVQEIGQAFSDELFRVYANEHPDVKLIPDNMTEQVKKMWQRAVSSR